MFIPPILYEMYPDIDSYTEVDITKLFEELNNNISVRHNIDVGKTIKKKKQKIIKKKKEKVIKIKTVRYNYDFKKKCKIIRAKYKVCQQCGGNYYMMVHHIDKDTNNNAYNNLILLCFHCHKKHHKHLNIP